MALSGSVTTGSWISDNGQTRNYTLSWTATQSITGNYSDVSWTLSATGSYSPWVAERTLNASINGTQVYAKTDRVERYLGAIASNTIRIYHGTDGTKSFNVTINAAVYGSTVNCTTSQTQTLNTIARKSSLSVANGTLGTAQTLTVSRQSTGFTHSIKAVCGTSTLYIKADGSTSTSEVKHSGTSISFKPPLSWASQNTTGTSVSVTYTITTYNGTTSIGSNSYSKSCSIPSSVAPSCSISVSDATGYADTYGGYLQGLSKLNITITPTLAYNSPIASYNTTLNGTVYTAASFTTGTLSYSGTQTITSKVTDKRSRSGTDIETITVLPYSKPAITLLKVRRCVSKTDGTEDPQGEFVQVTFSGKVDSSLYGNGAYWTLEYKKTSDTNWSSCFDESYEEVYELNEETYIFEADSGSSYDVRISVCDDFNTASWSTVVSTASTIMHFPASGEGMGIGKVVENDGHFELNYPSQFYKNAHFKERLTYDIPICDGGYDLDEMYGTSGMYYMGVSALNKPENVNGWLEVQSYLIGNYCYQKYICYTGNIYERWRSAGTWGDWVPYGTFSNPLYLPNGTAVYMKNASGTNRNALHMSQSNWLNLGYGGYAASEGTTAVYGNQVQILSKNNVLVNGMSIATNKVLWSGTSHMNASQSAPLSEAVSKQATGIVLIFSYYSGTATGDHDFSVHFVPKYLVSAHGGKGTSFSYNPPGYNYDFTGTKYLYISDTSIAGYANNTSSGTGTNGIKYDNSHRVLRYVIGV